MKHSLLPFLGLAGISTVATAHAQQQQPAANAGRKPNVIIILADDLGFGDLSCNGSSTIATPNVDRVAGSGIRFTNAHATSSVSTPSRFGLLTGEYPWRHERTGIANGDAGMIIQPGSRTMATMMHEAGYTTAAVGKWHLGLGETGKQDWNGTVTPGLGTIGFDYSFIMAATADRVPCVYIENSRVYNYDPEAPIAISYTENFAGEPTGRDNPEMLKLHPSHGHDMAIVNGIPRIGYMKGGGKALWKDEFIADVITQKAVEFISDNCDKPFFLYFGTNDVHVPRAPHERFVGRSGMGARGDAILQFDWSVGQVMDALDRLGIADNTVVIITSDNGPVVDDGYKDRAVELLGDHKPWHIYRGGKYSAYEAGTRIPFIIRWPEARNAGTTSSALVSQIDLYASLADYCGIEIPDTEAADSRNCLKALRGDAKTARKWVVEQNLNNTLSLICGDWKYITPNAYAPARINETDTELGNSPQQQLYNLSKDIGERNNVAEHHAGRIRRMKSLLQQVIDKKHQQR